MLIQVIGTGLFSLISWALFAFFFHKDRSRYRNCYFLSIALASLIPFILTVSGEYRDRVALAMMNAALLFLLIVPFFLMFNGIVMIRKEGKHLPQLLSLGLGIVILLGEAAFVATVFGFYLSDRFPTEADFYHSAYYIIGAVISVSVIYGSVAFLVFM